MILSFVGGAVTVILLALYLRTIAARGSFQRWVSIGLLEVCSLEACFQSAAGLTKVSGQKVTSFILLHANER